MSETRAAELIRLLALEPHVEGGWYRRSFCSESALDIETPGGNRPLLTSIYYLLTTEHDTGAFHLNRSGILHYFHEGDPIHYSLIYPDGHLQGIVMGGDLAAGQQLQLFVPGGVWKASRLSVGSLGYGLVSEAVAPGFDFEDMSLGRRADLVTQFPAHASVFEDLCRA